MQTYRSEGIILHALKFKDYDQILTVFTQEEGVIKLLFKGALSSKNGRGALTAPLSLVEATYTKKGGDLYMCKEIAMVEHHLSLRNKIEVLEAAYEMIKVIHDSQMPLKPAPELYKLLIYYLKKITTVSDPRILTASFRLKTLRYEGLLHLDPLCAHCGVKIEDLFFCQGECFCERHAPSLSLSFSPDEIFFIEALTYGKQLSMMLSLPLCSELQHKIQLLYKDLIK